MAISLAPRFTAALLLAAGLFLPSGHAQPANDVVVAKTTSPAGTFSARSPTEDYYRVLPANVDLKAGDVLATLPGAALAAGNKSVTLRCLADYESRAELPILESAFVLNEAKDVDFDFTLDRGRVEITNAKPTGKATLNLRFVGESWPITLENPGARIALELTGRWPAGSRFKPMAEKPSAPVEILHLLVLSGAVDVKVGGQTLSLAAKPAANRILWDSVNGPRTPELLANLPAWTDPDAKSSEQAGRVQAAIEKFRTLRADQAAKATDTFLASNDPIEQRIALVTLGANDDLGRLIKALGEARTLEQWDFSVAVLRHWLGRCAGQDQKLYDFLQADANLSASQARTVVQLLFGFGTDDLAQPETFEVLIDYLLHEKPAIRGLAAWHLARLVPKEKAVAYRPNATPAECEKLHQAWKKVIPSGELPPRGGK